MGPVRGQQEHNHVVIEPPPAKGEGDCERCDWPTELKADQVPLPAFKVFLKGHQNKKAAWAHRLLMSAGRGLGFFELVPTPDREFSIADVETLVAIFASRAHEELLAFSDFMLTFV